MDLREKIFAAFKKEYKTHLEGIRDFLSGYAEREKEGKPIDAGDMDKAKIRAHTLKGAAKAASLPVVQALAYGLETVFNRVKKGDLSLDAEVLDILRHMLAAVDDYVCSVEEDPDTEKPVDLIRRVNRCLGIDIEDSLKPGTKPGAREPLPVTEGKEKKIAIDKEKIRRKVFAVFLEEYKTHLENIRKLPEEPSLHDIDEAFREAHSLKGAARAADVPAVQTLAHRLETLFSRVKNETQPFGKAAGGIINRILDAVEDYVTALTGAGGVTAEPPPEPGEVIRIVDEFLGIEAEPVPGPPPAEPPAEVEIPRPEVSLKSIDTLRIDAEKLERLQETIGQVLAENQRQDILYQQVHAVETLLAEMSDQWGYLFKTSHSQLRRLESDAAYSKITGYLHFVNHHAQLLARKVRVLKETQKHIHQAGNYLGRQLQKEIQEARMIPAESMFQVFRKMVRDLAGDEGKSVEFRVAGFDIRADRLVLQSLKAPLMHILRNAVSHGIETPEQRKRGGKSETAKIDMNIEVKGSRIRIDIRDDGRGIDYRQVARTAVKKNLAPRETVEKPGSRELLHLLFQPGFSTAREVTDLSGRGIGLSVVKETLNRLQGDVDIHSEAQKGTRISLSVPLTVSSHRLLMVNVDGHIYGVPAPGIARLLQMDVSAIETLEGKPVIPFEGQPIPIFSLGYVLGIGDPILLTRQHRVPVIILRAAGNRNYAAVAVKEFIREQDVIIQELPPPVNRVPYFSGGFLQVDGSVSLVLNAAMLVEAARSLDKDKKTITLKSEEIKVREKKSKILIVDDSITTRTLEKTILDAHGYDVYAAVDGVEAFQFLQSAEVDLVITDIAMPRMDGFTLVEEMKKDDRLKSLPVIIVSSLDRREDRERGLALGADAYIVKQKFEQQDLLETIRQMI